MEYLKQILEKITVKKANSVDYVKTLHEIIVLLHANIVKIMEVSDDEVAILLLDQKGTLHFYSPDYLVNSGTIPASYTKSFVAKVLHEGRPKIENHFQTIDHLSLFEEFKKKNPNQLPIQKMLCVPLISNGKPYGAIEISKKGKNYDEAGSDWTESDLEKLLKVIGEIQNLLYILCEYAEVI